MKSQADEFVFFVIHERRARILRNLASLTKVTQAIVASVVVYCEVFYNFSVAQVTSVWVALLEVFLAVQFSHVARAL
jgi:hypothetical protein